MSITRKKLHYVPIAVSEDVKKHVMRIANHERRSMSQEARILIELGLAEYEKRHAIKSGDDKNES